MKNKTDQKTFREMKYFAYKADDVSASLRSNLSTVGGGVKHSCFAVDRNNRAVAAVAVDLYNHTVTGNVTMTLCGERMDPHHMPCVIEIDR